MSLVFVLPLAVYYGLRLGGVGQWQALVISGLLPAVKIVVTAVRHRRVDTLGVFVLVMMVLSLVVASFSGTPRILLARESWGTAACGVWLLGSLIVGRPVLVTGATQVMPADAASALADRWVTDTHFRTTILVLTSLWGGAFVVDALVRVWMAFELPVDSVPGASNVLTLALLVVATAASRRIVRVRRAANARQHAEYDRVSG